MKAKQQDQEIQVQPRHPVQTKSSIDTKQHDHQVQVQFQHLVQAEADTKEKQHDHQVQVQPRHLVQAETNMKAKQQDQEKLGKKMKQRDHLLGSYNIVQKPLINWMQTFPMAELDMKAKQQDRQVQVHPRQLDLQAQVQPRHPVQELDMKAKQHDHQVEVQAELDMMDANPLDVVIIALEEAMTEVPWHKIDNLLKNKCPKLTIKERADVVNSLSEYGVIVVSKDKCMMRIRWEEEREDEGSEWEESIDSD